MIPRPRFVARPAGGPHRSARRRAVASFVAIGFLVLFIAFSVVLARHAFAALRHERTAELEACASQIVESARAWAAAHPDALRPAEPTTLDITALLPAAAAGSAVLQRLDDAAPPAPGARRCIRVECRLDLQRGRDSIRQSWTLVVPG